MKADPFEKKKFQNMLGLRKGSSDFYPQTAYEATRKRQGNQSHDKLVEHTDFWA